MTNTALQRTMNRSGEILLSSVVIVCLIALMLFLRGETLSWDALAFALVMSWLLLFAGFLIGETVSKGKQKSKEQTARRAWYAGLEWLIILFLAAHFIRFLYRFALLFAGYMGWS